MEKKLRLVLAQTPRFYVFELYQKVKHNKILAPAAVVVEVVDQPVQRRKGDHGNSISSRGTQSATEKGQEASQSFPATERLYMLDTYLMSAEATVLDLVEGDKQDSAIILDRTVFHPQGGGQPSDSGTITCGSYTMAVSMVRDVGGVISHFGEISGATQKLAGERASLLLDGPKRLRHAALHSAGHAVDTAMMAAVGPGIFTPLKGYHFEDSPYVEYQGTLPDGLEKNALINNLNNELEKVVTADTETVVELLAQEREESVGVPSDSKGGSQQGFESAGTGSGGAGGVRKRHGTATRIVTVAGLACPCGGTHIKSTGQLEGVRVTKVKAKKGTLRVSYTLASPRS